MSIQLKTAGDPGLPLVAVGLLCQQGYFRQSLGAEGGPLASYPFNLNTAVTACTS
jgi:glycogen phosphorylase